MIKYIFNWLLEKFGKHYIVDNRIDDMVLFNFFCHRFIMLLRGLIFFRQKVFIGTNVKFIQKSNITIKSGATIEANVIFDACAQEKVLLGHNSKIGRCSTITITSHFSNLGKTFRLGNNSAIGEFSHMGCAGGLEIGNDVIMGSYISFHSENHNYENPNIPIRLQGVSHKGIKIGNNVWVGAKATFLDGATIGDNCIVAAGAVVRGTFPNNVIIGGVPAKIIKQLYE